MKVDLEKKKLNHGLNPEPVLPPFVFSTGHASCDPGRNSICFLYTDDHTQIGSELDSFTEL